MIAFPAPGEACLLAAVALAASTLAAVTGFGGAALLTPVLAHVFGPRVAIPVLAVAQLAGNGSRVWFNRKAVDWRVVGWCAAGILPASYLGARLFAQTPAPLLNRLLGAFFLFAVVWRRLRTGPPWKPPLRTFAGIGAGCGLLSAFVGGVGPLFAPFFLAYGLVKGAYIGTEAMATVVMHTVKLAGYAQGGVLGEEVLLYGAAFAPIMVAGSWIGKRVLDRLPEKAFVLLVEIVLVVAGGTFLFRG